MLKFFLRANFRKRRVSISDAKSGSGGNKMHNPSGRRLLAPAQQGTAQQARRDLVQRGGASPREVGLARLPRLLHRRGACRGTTTRWRAPATEIPAWSTATAPERPATYLAPSILTPPHPATHLPSSSLSSWRHRAPHRFVQAASRCCA